MKSLNIVPDRVSKLRAVNYAFGGDMNIILRGLEALDAN
jgi:hypothetical protein